MIREVIKWVLVVAAIASLIAAAFAFLDGDEVAGRQQIIITILLGLSADKFEEDCDED